MLMGTTREELDPACRSVWIDLICLAGQSNDHGHIIPHEESLPRILKVPKRTIDKALELCERHGKITRNDGQVVVVNFDKYHFRKHQTDAYCELEQFNSHNSENVARSDKIRSDKIEIRSDEKRLDLKPHGAKSKNRTVDPSEPNAGELVRYFIDSWSKLYGEKPPFGGGQLGKFAKAQLKEHGEVEVKRRMDNFFASKNKFVVQATHGPGVFQTKFAALKKGPIRQDGELDYQVGGYDSGEASDGQVRETTDIGTGFD